MTASNQPPVDDEQKALAGVLDGLLGAMDQGSRAAALAMLDRPAMERVKDALNRLDPDHFHLALGYPFERLIDGLLSLHGVTDPRAKFVFRHADFLDTHFKTLFDKLEGPACCADKSRWAVRALARSFISGQPIVIDLTQEYTYHLPSLTFTDHEQIVEFFDGLYRLYYGKPEPYLTAMLRLRTRVANAQADATRAAAHATAENATVDHQGPVEDTSTEDA